MQILRGDTRLNRNILECKCLISPYRLVYSLLVLIETYWNVNVEEMFVFRKHILVLIETYWNVNKPLTVTGLALALGLNRNILECKFVYGISGATDRLCLNRNILECKSRRKRCRRSGRTKS